MNPNLTANLRADRKLKAEVEQQQLREIREKLAAAQPHLAEAINLIHSLGLATSHFELYSHLADAHFHCGEAIYEIDQNPQPDELYDVATEGHPIKGKLHPPEPAFDAIDITNDPDFEF